MCTESVFVSYGSGLGLVISLSGGGGVSEFLLSVRWLTFLL